ncbi:MAG: Gfo/Idh/MocA family oxidoreductase [Acidobacteriaceae bacterium]|nr:Gfo/Idh/MocA family oxidoreductase [Acidobacteriaceae bacterium]
MLSASLSFGSYLPWRHPWEDYRVGYGARRELGGGVILDAIHEMDYAQWLFGSPSSLYCISGKYSDLEIDVEDLAEILLAYPDKLVSIHLDYIAQPAHRTCTILGTWGQLRVDLVERRLRHFDGETREWSTIPVDGSISESYEAEMRHFLDCIEGSAKPEVDAECARQSLEIAEAARRSMLLGSPVTVESMVEVASEVMS